MSYAHLPVLLEEVLFYLVNDDTRLFLDCTLGEGGHSFAILNKYGQVSVFGLDRDTKILEVAGERLSGFGERFTGLNLNFKEASSEGIKTKGGELFDSALIDLGISNFHYKKSGRGFSFSQHEKLNMGLDSESGDVFEIINNADAELLADIFLNSGKNDSQEK